MAARNLRRAANSFRTLPDRWVRDAAKRVAKPTTSAVTGDSGGDRRLSGASGHARFRVISKVSGNNVVLGEVTAGPSAMRAQWFWLEEGTRPRRQGRGRHPGTRAKRTWSREVAKVLPTISAEAERKFHQAVQGR